MSVWPGQNLWVFKFTRKHNLSRHFIRALLDAINGQTEAFCPIGKIGLHEKRYFQIELPGMPFFILVNNFWAVGKGCWGGLLIRSFRSRLMVYE